MTPDPSRHIVIASFPNPAGAISALELLKGSTVGLGNTATIVRDAKGNVDFSESADWGVGKSALVGAIAGMLLPGVGTITMAAGGAIAAYFIDLGFPDALLKQMGEGLHENSSMLVALVDASSVERASQVVVQAGGTVMGTSHESDLAAAMANLKRP